MTASATPDLFGAVPQSKWKPAKGKGGCGRDPQAGPGSCWHWWELCPNAEKRGCYQLWLKARQVASV